MKIISPIGICAGLLLEGCMNEENPVHSDMGLQSQHPMIGAPVSRQP